MARASYWYLNRVQILQCSRLYKQLPYVPMCEHTSPEDFIHLIKQFLHTTWKLPWVYAFLAYYLASIQQAMVHELRMRLLLIWEFVVLFMFLQASSSVCTHSSANVGF